MREMYEQNLPPRFLLSLHSPCHYFSSGIHHYWMKLLQRSLSRHYFSLVSSFHHHVPYCFKGDLSSTQICSPVYCLQDKSFKVAHLPILVLHGPHCPEKVTHVQSSVYAIRFVRNTASFHWGGTLPSFKSSFSNVPTGLLPLVPLLVCLSPLLVCKFHEG